jgi:hypothetical protein
MTNYVACQGTAISSRIQLLVHSQTRILAVLLLFGLTHVSFQRSAVTALAVQSKQGAINKAGMTARHPAVPKKWFIFTSPDGDFRLQFPAKPNAEAASEGPVTLIRTFSLTTAEGMSFSINFQDKGGDPQASENNEWGRDFEEATSEADRKSGRRVVQIHRLAKNTVEAELWQPVADSGANINYLRRSILRRGRVYTLSCGSILNRRPVDKTICLRFFTSMRFIRKPPESRRSTRRNNR